MSRKKVEKIEKRINQTVHQLAMTRPEVREALEALRACWSDLSPLQRGEQLNVLIGFKCSAGGIAKELGKPATSILRYIALANPPEHWIETMERTWAPECRRAKHIERSRISLSFSSQDSGQEDSGARHQ